VTELLVRPKVGMRQIVAVPYVIALGVCRALPELGIAWPYGLANRKTGRGAGNVVAHAGYDDDGMYVRASVELPGANEDALVGAVESSVREWSDALEGRPAMGPLAPVLADYADALVCLGGEVDVTYPNGSSYARGTFVGVDVWGRATVRLAGGQELEFPPEKYRMRQVPDA